MWDVRVCAACLATDVRMYSMSAASLLEPYRLLTGIEFEEEGMPQKLCWECAALVHKFNKFRHKCERASLLLQDIYNKHDEVSEQEVLKVNREQHNLISSYTICPIQVYNLSSGLKTKIKKSHKDKKSEAEKTKDTQTGDAQKEPVVKLEIEIIKKEEVALEMKSETHDTELIQDVFVEEDCSQVVKLESPQMIKRVRKSIQGLKQTEKNHLKPRDVFIEEDCSQAVQLQAPQKIKRVRKRRQRPKPKAKKQLKARDFGMNEESLSQEQQMEVMREKQNTKVYKSAPFPCTLCYIHFNEEEAFKNHMLKHDPVCGELICDICKLRFKKRPNLRCHIQGLHMKRYSCQSCSSVFYNRHTARKHYAWHKGVVYTCGICGASYDKNTTYQSHLRNKHSSDHVCDQCGTPFHSKKGLLCHVNLAHKLKRDVASGGEQEMSGPYCAECDIQFTCKQAWTRHVLISPKHQHERHICYLGCDICGETLPDEKSLRAHRVIHRRTHRYTKYIKCEQCGEVMESHRAYDEHFRREHPGETQKPRPIRKQRNYPANAPCMCELCGKVYTSRMALTQHSYKHSGRRPFKCDTCSKTFISRPALKLHIRTHTKEMPYKCDICGRGFASPFNFDRHKKIVHTDARPYACDICGKRFKCRGSVKAHIECVHLQKPWPKRDRSKRQNGNESSRGDKHKLMEHS